jgi:hypothetical protein
MFTGDPTAAALLFIFEGPKMGRPYLPYINLFPVFQVCGCFSDSHFGVVFEFRFRHGFSVPSLKRMYPASSCLLAVACSSVLAGSRSGGSFCFRIGLRYYIKGSDSV